MRYNLLFPLAVALFCTNIHLSAQVDICIGKSHITYSEVLKEERTIWVHLPESYSESVQKTYPVIYLLDGDLFFHSLVAIQRSLSRGRQPIMPECLIVGILNTDRTRDLTPTKSAYRRDGKLYDSDKEVGGGSKLFNDYLCRELRTEIDKRYRTNGQNIIIGHSFGGLFVLNAILNNSDFYAYIALDPSFWWDDGFISRKRYAGDKTPRFLYIGLATGTQQGSGNIHWTMAEKFRNETMPLLAANGIQTTWKDFSSETHGTIPIPGMLDALKHLFNKK